jgi:hypothetical protein
VCSSDLTGKAYDDYDLASDLLDREIVSRDEREDIKRLSNEASTILEMYGEGENTRRRAEVPDGQLTRVVLDGAWIFTLEDTLDERHRCRSWRLGGEGVSWCDDEWRYEEAAAVYERLMQLFPLQKVTEIDATMSRLDSIRRQGSFLKRELARAIFR